MSKAEATLLDYLRTDKKYGKISDRYAKMRYAVERYSKMMARYGKFNLEQCALYERDHTKDVEVVALEQRAIEQILAKHDADEGFSAEEYKSLLKATNNLLRHLPIDWSDWPWMLSVLKLYLSRAEIEFDRKLNRAALSDLRHATGVLKHFDLNLEVIYAHFENGTDSVLLLKMLHLQRELMAKKAEICTEVKAISSRAEVEKAITTICKNDSLYEVATKPAFSGNLKMSEKARMMYSAEAGRFVVATADIEEGEKVLLERAQNMMHFDDSFLTHCDYCQRKLPTFWPCSGCSELGYCSVGCAEAAYLQYHHAECGIFGYILNNPDCYTHCLAYRHYVSFGIGLAMACEEEQLAAEQKHDDGPRLLKDFFASTAIRDEPYGQLGPADKRTLCNALTTQLSHRGDHDLEQENLQTVMAVSLVYCLIYKGILSEEVVEDSERYSTLLEHLSTFIMRMCTNAFAWDEDVEEEEGGDESIFSLEETIRVGCGTFLEASLLNHSCDPNVRWNIDEGIITLKASRPIYEGQEISVSYGPKPYHDFNKRHNRLRRDYIFFCLCELCQLDTATATNTLKCQAPDRQCLGPLVPNDFRACLLCGHEVSKSDCDRLVARGKKASDEFSRVINKIYHPDTRTKLKVVLNAVGIGRRSNLKVDAADQDFLLGKMDDVLLTAKQIAQLERQLVVCTEVFYGGSYHLLEKCILLLKVYRDANLEERSLTLIAPLTRSVGAILPSRTDCTLVKLPRMLDYAASFYEEFALKCRSLPTPFWELFRLLNDKLLQVLQFDLNYRGHFFPISQLRLDKNVPIEELQEHEDVCFDAEEHNFRQLYRACRRRLNALDAAANEETTSQQ